MASDPNVAQSLSVTFIFAAITVPLTMLASLGLRRSCSTARAVRPERRSGRSSTCRSRSRSSPRTLVWIGFLNPETGWMNEILGVLRDPPGPDWINSETWIYPALSLIGLWGIGNFMLINIAGLQSVPTELYEAARIDGAGRWTLVPPDHDPADVAGPALQPGHRLIGTFQYFTQAYTLTNGRGDPDNATLFINLDSTAKHSSSTTWATARPSPGCCSRSSWS